MNQIQHYPIQVEFMQNKKTWITFATLAKSIEYKW